MSVVANSQAVANEAIMLIGDNQPLVTGGAPNFDGSAAGIVLSQIYGPTVAAVMRQFGWDLARNQVALSQTDNVAPFPWQYEYAYPANCIEVWQLMPPTLSDPYNPLPINWSVGNTVVDGTQVKVIWSNLAGALLIYNNGPQESTWDSLFTEAVVRLLASKLATAIVSKPETAATMLQSGSAFEGLGESRGDV